MSTLQNKYRPAVLLQGPVGPALEECSGLRGHSVLGRIPEEERLPEGDDDED